MNYRPLLRFAFLLSLFASISGNYNAAKAQGPEGKSFGFGIILPDPLGVTVKAWTSPVNAVVADFGGYSGSLRLQFDYLWHFDAFHSRIVEMYAGPGLGVAFNTDNAGVGIRGIFGINVIPIATPVEIFFELGPLIELSPEVGASLDVAVGIRFYP